MNNNASLQNNKMKMPTLTREGLNIILKTLNGAEIDITNPEVVAIKEGVHFTMYRRADIERWMTDDALLQRVKDSKPISLIEAVKLDKLRKGIPTPEEIKLAAHATGKGIAIMGLFTELYSQGNYNGMVEEAWKYAPQKNRDNCEKQVNKLGFTPLSVAIGVAQNGLSVAKLSASEPKVR